MNYPEPTRWIQHNTHTQHPLKEVYKNAKFKCKACKCKGRGMRYRCEPCNFDIHSFCGTCPVSVLSFTHPQHLLQLVQKPVSSDQKCNLCHKTVHGMVYQCQGCNLYIHPLCTQFPEFLPAHAMHPPHSIRLQLMESKKCDVCNKSCKRWRYHCGVCHVHIHAGCLSGKPTSRFDDFLDQVMENLAVEAITG